MMPPRRQLPWAIKHSSKKTTVKPPPAKRAVQSDIDDDFFHGTVLESSRKGKERANDEDSDHELPITTRKGRETSRGAHLPSSSPPPIAANLPPPTTEFMLTGVDKFDLCDDEWMMVEDELLQTAKLFTQHLHLAEYETLKKKMEELRKENAARPVVPNAKPSVEGHFKRKAQEQAEKQRKALRAVISTHESDSEGDEEPQRAVPNRSAPSFPPPRPLSTARATATSRPLQRSGDVRHGTASDSDDLDAPKRPPIAKLSDIPPKAPPKAPAHTTPGKRSEVFVKPAIPSKSPRKPARGQRRNLWDNWDELTATPKSSIPTPSPSHPPYKASSSTKTVGPTTNQQSSSPPTAFHTSVPLKRPGTTLDDDDLNAPRRNQLAKDTADRIARRKADKDREEKKKQKYDDIPTFLF